MGGCVSDSAFKRQQAEIEMRQREALRVARGTLEARYHMYGPHHFLTMQAQSALAELELSFGNAVHAERTLKYYTTNKDASDGVGLYAPDLRDMVDARMKTIHELENLPSSRATIRAYGGNAQGGALSLFTVNDSNQLVR